MENKEQNDRLSESLMNNIIRLRGEFNETIDFTVREFLIDDTPAALFSMEGLVDKKTVSQSIMLPVLNASLGGMNGEQKMKCIRDHVLAPVEQTQIVNITDVMDRLMSGFAVLAIDGCSFMLAFGVQGFDMRSITEPENEITQRGSREGFIEAFQINISMIRRRMRTPNLMFEKLVMGSKSQTAVTLCYLRGVASEEILRQIRTNLHKANLETVMAAGYIAPFLQNGGLFNGIGLSERPDTVCGKIAEGRIAIIVDGTPNVIIVPYLFSENFQSFDDYANRPYYATFIRCLKYFSFFLSILLPGIYVAVMTFHPELLPDNLLLKIASAEANTPFPLMAEAILLYLIYEIMREAGLRSPKPLSNAVGILGALVIGETAINSGLVSAPTLMVVALTAISGYLVPQLYEPVAVSRLGFIIIGGTFGIWGILLSFSALLLNLCSQNVFKVPITAPLSPFSLKAMRDTIFRASWRTLAKKSDKIQEMPGTELKTGRRKR